MERELDVGRSWDVFGNLHFGGTKTTSTPPAEEDIGQGSQRKQKAAKSPVDVLGMGGDGEVDVTDKGVGLPKVERMLFETRFFGDR